MIELIFNKIKRKEYYKYIITWYFFHITQEYLETYGYLEKTDKDPSRGGVGHDEASRSQGIR